MSTDVQHHAEHHYDSDATDVLGFWLYIMTDCVLFASLFAVFAVLHNNIYGGPALKQLIELPYVFGETAFLLLSNLTYGLGMLALYRRRHAQLRNWLLLTIGLGLGFVIMEVNEFVELIHRGLGPQHSASLSSFFTLVGTHGLHVSFGLLWMIILVFQLKRFGVNRTMSRRLTYLGLFWNFLDIVWIFVFTIVYLLGAI